MAFVATNKNPGELPFLISASSSQLPVGQKLPPVLTRASGVDAFAGAGEFVLAFGSTGVVIGTPVFISFVTGATTTFSSATTTLGTVGVSMAANTDTTALSWFQIYGQTAIRASAATVGLPCYAGATGLVTDVVTAGKLISGTVFSGRVLNSTITTKVCSMVLGRNEILVPNTEGLFVGCSASSSTGVPAGSVVTGIGFGGLYSGYPSPAVNVVQIDQTITATTSESVTFGTGANFAVINVNYPFFNGFG